MSGQPYCSELGECHKDICCRSVAICGAARACAGGRRAAACARASRTGLRDPHKGVQQPVRWLTLSSEIPWLFPGKRSAWVLACWQTFRRYACSLTCSRFMPPRALHEVCKVQARDAKWLPTAAPKPDAPWPAYIAELLSYLQV